MTFGAFNMTDSKYNSQPVVSKALDPYQQASPFDMSFGYNAVKNDAYGNLKQDPMNFAGSQSFTGMGNGFNAIGGTLAPHQATWSEKAFGYTDPVTGKSFGGYAAPAVSLLQAGLGFAQGNRQLKLNRDALDASKDQFSKQYETQKQLTNLDIMDHAKARYDRDPTNYATPEEYYQKNRLV